jgi:hypothetical protein
MTDLDDGDEENESIPPLAYSAGAAGLKVSNTSNTVEEFHNKLIFVQMDPESLEIETSFDVFEELDGFEYSTLLYCFYQADTSISRENLYITRIEIDLSTLKYDENMQKFNWKWKTQEFGYFGKGGWTGVRPFGDSLL